MKPPPHFSRPSRRTPGCCVDVSCSSVGCRYVDFTQFERWWKHRVGLLEADTPVIPEFFEYKMAEMSEAQKQKARQQQQRHLAKLPSSFTIKVRGKSKKFDALQLARNGFVDTVRTKTMHKTAQSACALGAKSFGIERSLSESRAAPAPRLGAVGLDAQPPQDDDDHAPRLGGHRRRLRPRAL
eukprot:SAG11_NODE_103_length_16571_cov_49.569208_9_plen_183_part_00